MRKDAKIIGDCAHVTEDHHDTSSCPVFVDMAEIRPKQALQWSYCQAESLASSPSQPGNTQLPAALLEKP